VLPEAEGDSESEDCDEKDDIEKASDDEDEETATVDKYEVFAFLHQNILISAQDKLAIPKSWILMDSQSTLKSGL